ncbi:MAG TPA: hypothetical protein VN899_07220 [Stellaceae bacterium]|nr:hypothetical protein [Stellaceae bacterium]
MPSLARFSLAALLGLGLLSACSSPPSPQYPDIRFNGAPAMKLDASAIDVREPYSPPGKAPNVDHLFPVTPLHALESWAHDRLAPAGNASRAVFTILDASVVEVDLPRKTGFFSTTFTTQESERYDMKLVARLDLLDAKGLVVRTASVTGIRSQSVTDDISPNKRDQVWYDMLKAAMTDFDKQMESEIRGNFGVYLKP